MSFILSQLWSHRVRSAVKRRERRRRAMKPLVEALETLQLLSASPAMHFQFGTASSPIKAGYTRIAGTAYTAAKGYGWKAGSAVYNDSFYSATASPHEKGFNYSANATFLVNLPNGKYNVTPTLNDPFRAIDSVSLFAQGQKVASSLKAAANQSISPTYQVTVTNGQLSLRVATVKANNPYFGITQLDVSPVATTSTVTAAAATTATTFSAHYQFGTATSPVASGYTRVAGTAYASTSGYGWSPQTPIYSDSFYDPNANPQELGFNYGPDNTFLVDLPNGTYSVTPTLNDPYRAIDGVSLFAQGQQVASGLSAGANQSISSTYQITVTNGQLALRVADINGSNPYFGITRLDIAPATSASDGGSSTGSSSGSSAGSTSGSSSGSSSSGQVTIDQTWLQNAGSAPYVLNQANTTYVLATDVKTSGTAFVVAAANVTLNLNGHTVTYGNSSALTVPNGGFEQGTKNWDLSQASGASIVPNSMYLFGKQVLSLPSISQSKQITSSKIAIPQANHTYTATITPLAGQQDTTITLSVIDAVTGQVLGSATSYDPQRGFSAVVNFTPTTTNPVKLQVVATPPSGQTDTVYLDDATLTSSYDYGIIASQQWSGQIPGFSNLSTAAQAGYRVTSGFTVQNGSIVQGSGNGYGSMPIFAEQLTGLTITNVKTSDTGMDNGAVDANYASGAITITGSTFQEAAYNISNRMRDYSTLQLNNTNGPVQVTGNTILGSPELGIMATYNNPSFPFAINNNTIKQKTVVTNGYAIAIVAMSNFQVNGNTIQPTSGRGIDIDGWSATPTANGQIQNNYVSVQENGNREYGNNINAFALRVRNNVDAEGPQRNLTFSGNTFISTTSLGQDLGAIAARITYGNNNGAMNNANIVFTNNTFRAIVNTTDPNYYAQAFDIDSMDAGIKPVITNNVFSSNDISLQLTGPDGDSVNDVQLVGNTIDKSSLGAVRSYSPIVAGFWIDPISNVQMIDTTYTNGASPTIRWSGEGTKSIQMLNTLNIAATSSSGAPLAGAIVTITDANNNVVYSGITDAQGTLAGIPLVVVDYEQTGTDPTQIATSGSNLFNVTVANGGTTKSKPVQLGPNTKLSVSF
jgi:hypothetical protein